VAWQHVFPRVAAFAQVVAFDRAGLGQSEPGPLPRSAGTAVDDLRQMLTRAGIPGPYILVGHSMGGLHARLYASLYPAEVVGLVLIDSPHEEMLDVWRSLLPPEVWEQFIGFANYEGSDYALSMEQIKAAPALPDIPLIVLTARYGSYPYGWPREALDAVRVQMQGQIAERAMQGCQIIIDDTGHEIQRDQPALIIDAIRQVIAR
jgi:pimeloyl-ACP methyl ester carboxylesterase